MLAQDYPSAPANPSSFAKRDARGLKKEVVTKMAEKKRNKPSIVQNKGVESMKNTFEGKIRYLPLNQLADFKNHPFKVEMNTELFELMQSIEKEGVLVPLLARPNPTGQGYELIAGHRRKAASKWAGWIKYLLWLWNWMIIRR